MEPSRWNSPAVNCQLGVARALLRTNLAHEIVFSDALVGFEVEWKGQQGENLLANRANHLR